MRLEEEQELLAEAAAPILERIRSDHERASAQVKPLLRYLEEHLFEIDLCVDVWFRTCDIHDHLMTARFHKEMGLGPATYLWDCRLHTASGLLRNTSLPVSTVGQVTGFFDRRVFETSFEKWSNEEPTIYREKARARAAKYGQPPEWMLSTSFLRRLETGKLTSDEVRAVRQRLQHLQMTAARQDSVKESIALNDDNERFEQWMASKLWKKIEKMPFEKQKLFVANQVAYKTTALSDLLLEKSDEFEGLARRQLEHLADLAEEALQRTLAGKPKLISVGSD